MCLSRAVHFLHRRRRGHGKVVRVRGLHGKLQVLVHELQREVGCKVAAENEGCLEIRERGARHAALNDFHHGLGTDASFGGQHKAF